MKTKTGSNYLQNSLKRVALRVGFILLAAVLGDLFVTGWNWGPADYIIMGALLFGTGMAVDIVAQKIKDPLKRSLVILAVIVLLMVIWAELAVDAVSKAIAVFL